MRIESEEIRQSEFEGDQKLMHYNRMFLSTLVELVREHSRHGEDGRGRLPRGTETITERHRRIT